MHFVEVIVNVPIRRTFNRRLVESEPAPAWLETGEEPPDEDAAASTQTFHYHLPPELNSRIMPGHLVWAPFGARQVQGIVLRRAESSPVPTKAVTRLARPEPVLTQSQLTLAGWIAQAYVAPLSMAVKLFLPPGLMEKEKGGPGVRAKREEQIAWVGGDLSTQDALLRLARETQQTRALAWLLEQPEGMADEADLRAACGVKDRNVVHRLVAKELVRVENGSVQLLHPPETTQAMLETMRGVEKFRPVIETLRRADGPMWKSDLYQAVEIDLAGLRRMQAAGLVALDERVRFRDPLAGRIYPATSSPTLSSEQEVVWQRLAQEGLAQLAPGASNGTGADRPAPEATPGFLIHGVTGSGKTEIYLRAIETALEKERQAVVLVPEISLTPQTVARFAGRFPGRVTVIHSGLSHGERYDVWRKVREGEFDVVVGPRSALFSPLARLGLIVIDEEHEPAYKQDAELWGSNQIFYDARQVARRLAAQVGGVVIMGSATPSLESYAAAQSGDLTLLEMPRRVMGHAELAGEPAGTEVGPAAAGRAQAMAAEGAVAAQNAPVVYGDLPPVEVVDMRLELRAGNRSVLSRALQAELHATLDAGRQAILFLNRRGNSTFVMCRDCGDVQRCTRCDVPLTYHNRAAQLVCHHCNRRYPVPEICPACNSKHIRYFGSGTQRIEHMVHELAPRARVIRWDADTAAKKGSHETILAQFANHEADVLVGTQMIAKGLDLPLVTLVGVVAADIGLYLPDFRAGERTFQLLTQVAGRAGRSHHGGRVVIQSYTPEHYVIQAAAQHDYSAFFAREMAYRRELNYPPIRRMARLVYWEKHPEKAQTAAEEMRDQLQARLQQMGVAESATLIGPAPAFFARFRGYYRWQLLLLTADPAAVLRPLNFPFGWRVDVDPVSIL